MYSRSFYTVDEKRKRWFLLLCLFIVSLCSTGCAHDEIFDRNLSFHSFSGTINNDTPDFIKEIEAWNIAALSSECLHLSSPTFFSTPSFSRPSDNHFYRKCAISQSCKLQIALHFISSSNFVSQLSYRHFYTIGLQKMRC